MQRKRPASQLETHHGRWQSGGYRAGVSRAEAREFSEIECLLFHLVSLSLARSPLAYVVSPSIYFTHTYTDDLGAAERGSQESKHGVAIFSHLLPLLFNLFFFFFFWVKRNTTAQGSLQVDLSLNHNCAANINSVWSMSLVKMAAKSM